MLYNKSIVKLRSNGGVKMNGMKLRELRKARKLSAMDLATELGVTPGAVFGWEKGLWDITFAHLEQIADYFGVDTDYFRNNKKAS